MSVYHINTEHCRLNFARNKIFKVVLPYTYMGMAVPLPCDLDQLYKLSFSFPQEASHEVQLIGLSLSEMFEYCKY